MQQQRSRRRVKDVALVHLLRDIHNAMLCYASQPLQLFLIAIMSHFALHIQYLTRLSKCLITVSQPKNSANSASDKFALFLPKSKPNLTLIQSFLLLLFKVRRFHLEAVDKKDTYLYLHMKPQFDLFINQNEYFSRQCSAMCKCSYAHDHLMLQDLQ